MLKQIPYPLDVAYEKRVLQLEPLGMGESATAGSKYDYRGVSIEESRSASHRNLFRDLERENARLHRAVDELSILNELAAEIGRARDVDEISQSIIRKARRAARAAEGVITLVRDEAPGDMKTLVRTRVDSQDAGPLRPTDRLLGWMHHHRSPMVIGREDEKSRREMGLGDASIQTLLSVPMLVGGRLVGILTAYNREDGADFTTEDVRLLSIMAAQSAQVIERARLDEERRTILQTFGQYTSPEIVEQILKSGSHAKSTRRHVCILFMDLRGFSSFAEREEPEEVVDYLAKLFDVAIDSVNNHHGIVHQLLGDGMMAIFGAPVSYGNDEVHAVMASLDMIERIEQLVDAGELPPTRLGIGLHSGEVVAGTIGSSVHREYKVTGDVVNVASRVEELNKRFDSRLLVTEAVFRKLDGLDGLDVEAMSMGSVAMSGREGQVHLYRLA